MPVDPDDPHASTTIANRLVDQPRELARSLTFKHLGSLSGRYLRRPAALEADLTDLDGPVPAIVVAPLD